MDRPDDVLLLDDDALLAQCRVHTYRASGPGGQHRNKVSSAVRLKHQPTGVVAHGDERRSQQENKAAALRRLRMEIACRLRRPTDPAAPAPEVVRRCTFVARGGSSAGRLRLEVGPKDRRFWAVAARLLDVLEACGGGLAPAARAIGVTTGNLVSVLQSDRHLLIAAQTIRKRHGCKPIA